MNVFYFIGGLLTIFLSVAHVFWGEKKIAKELKTSSISELPKAGFYISYHQITMTLLISGLSLIIISLFDSIKGINTLALFITILIIGNFSVFIGISLIKYRNLFAQTIPQMFFYLVLILLLFLGIYC